LLLLQTFIYQNKIVVQTLLYVNKSRHQHVESKPLFIRIIFKDWNLWFTLKLKVISSNISRNGGITYVKLHVWQLIPMSYMRKLGSWVQYSSFHWKISKVVHFRSWIWGMHLNTYCGVQSSFSFLLFQKGEWPSHQ
jgi:hypothetical protein